MAFIFSNDIYKPKAKELIEKFNMQHIDLDSICFITNDSGRPEKYAARINKFRPPYHLFAEYTFYIEVFDKKTADMTDAQIYTMIYSCLLSIDTDGESLIRPDVNDFSAILNLVGPNWLDNPNILNIVTDFND